MARLPKKYIKLYGISKRAWREYNKSKGKSKPARRGNPGGSKNMAKKKGGGRRRGRNYITKQTWDGAIAQGLKVVANKVMGPNQIVNAVIDGGMGIFRNNNTLLGEAVVEGIGALLPNLNLGGSLPGGWES